MRLASLTRSDQRRGGISFVVHLQAP